MAMSSPKKTICPCGIANKIYDQCCGTYHQNIALAETPEKLMRARYSAFVKKNFDFLLDTTAPNHRHEFNMKSNKDWAESVQFVQLQVIRSLQNGDIGQVEFKAHYLQHGQVQIHHELSDFQKINNKWFFKNGRSMS